MLPTISALRSWPDTDRASTIIGDAATVLDGASRTMIRACDAGGKWYGATRSAVDARVRAEGDHGDEVRNVLQSVADTTEDAARDIGYARDHVLREVRYAQEAGFTVSDVGDVTHPLETSDPDAKAVADNFEAAIRSGLATIDVFDEKYGAALEELSADLHAMTNGQPHIRLPDGRTMDADDLAHRLRGMTPEARRRLIDALDSTALRHLIQADPTTVGNLDGIPFAVRIRANHLAIRTALSAEISAGRSNSARAQQLRTMLLPIPDPAAVTMRGGRAVAGRGADDQLVDRQYVAFSDTPNGRFVEMIGTLGPTTRGAAVYVPGTGTNLNSSEPNHRAAWSLAQQSGAPVFLYADGDLPQTLVPGTSDRNVVGAAAGLAQVLSGNPIGGHAALLGTIAETVQDVPDSALSDHSAREMAPRLVGFARELDVEIAHSAPGATTTVIGHSYGGSIVGTAEQLGLRADRVVYASSAGTGVLDGPWHNPQADVRRYSITAPGDPIQYIQGLAASPHGGDPDITPGVGRLDTGTYSALDPANHPAGSAIRGLDGHSGYWNDPGSTGFRNMVAVIRGDEAEPYVHREDDAPARERIEAPARTGLSAARRAGESVVEHLSRAAGRIVRDLVPWR
ncbi:alpha/beta hydrolase [Gordonia soli]|uniref:DUF1023 domain-containing protein n=1 Tax=Gordonia soli NBRC 108243 TaxID=1223545 RepID=M0QGQ2_9ACTN|nr:alpha/beta hydrolase [Gordonia soli]GAC67471.1 hypothetical protein GS4_08_00550 [Gordonia soli NBRC 108243]